MGLKRSIFTAIHASRNTGDVNVGGQAFAATTWTTLLFPTEHTDKLSEYDPGTGVFVPGSDGLYTFTVAMHVDLAAAGRLIYGLWNAGASIEIARFHDVSGYATGHAAPAGAVTIPLERGTQYTARHWTSQAHTSIAGPEHNFIRIYRVG